MAKVNRKAMLIGVGVVSAAGLAGSAFAASIGGTTSGNAGQGVKTVAGYTAGPVTYNGNWNAATNANTNTDVTSFTFVLKKDADGTGASSITSGNTTVYAQLTGGTASNWILCTPAATGGTVTCTTSGKALSTVEGVSIVAYDK